MTDHHEPPTGAVRAPMLLFVHSGSPKKRMTFDAARQIGADIHLINTQPGWADGLASNTIFTGRLSPPRIIDLACSLGASGTYDGVVTFWEEDVPTCAIIAHELGLPGNAVSAALDARSKCRMRGRLERGGVPVPTYALIKSTDDLAQAAIRVGFPAVLKPEWGSDSEWVAKVTNYPDLLSTYRDLSGRVRQQDCIYGYPPVRFVLESFLSGPEVSVEGVVQDGVTTIYAIIDKARMSDVDFIERGETTPSRLSTDEQCGVERMVCAGVRALGLKNSGIHGEVKLTPDGPRIVEIGARMGGDCIHALVKRVYGIDLALENLNVALGRPVAGPTTPNGWAISTTLVPETPGLVRAIGMPASRGNTLIEVVKTKAPGEEVLVPPDGYDNLAWVSVWGKDHASARRSLSRNVRRMWQTVEVDSWTRHAYGEAAGDD